MRYKKFLIVILCIFKSVVHSYEKWETTELLWNFNWIQESDKGLNLSPQDYFKKTSMPFNPDNYHNIEKGDLVWVQTCHIERFYHEVLPLVKNPFILLISEGDESFPSNCRNHFVFKSLIKNKNILHIFAQNCDYQGSSKKVSPIPIGIDFHTLAYKRELPDVEGSPQAQVLQLKHIVGTLLPTSLRLKRAFVDFQHFDSMQRNPRYGNENRTTIFNQLKETHLIDYGPLLPRSQLWKVKGNYAFSISPHGNGLDCHRTWEDLVLGCIVIVKTSPLDPLYEGLPVVIVQDWSEVTEENLNRWLLQYSDAFTNPFYREKLTNRYWINKIQELKKII